MVWFDYHQTMATELKPDLKLGPNIAGVAALIGDPARANMLTALLPGAALTASELTLEAGVSKATASFHLGKLEDGGLVALERQGRHRYYRLADADVAHAIEALTGVAARAHPQRVRSGPKEPALRRARVCYDHLAGDLGVALYEALLAQGWLVAEGDAVAPTEAGVRALSRLGVDVEARRGSRPLCRICLDWSVRRHHLAGALGAAILQQIFACGWARRRPQSRVVELSSAGERAFRRAFGMPAATMDRVSG
jgi:DNA-binding transcriptional ArsR family regulator